MLTIEEMLLTASDEQKALILEAKERFKDELSKLPKPDGKTLNNSVNTQYRQLAVKYQKAFKEIMK